MGQVQVVATAGEDVAPAYDAIPALHLLGEDA